MSDTESFLATAADIASAIAKGPVPPYIGIPATIAAMALKAGAAIAGAGGNPVIEISRMLSPAVKNAKIHQEWADFIEKNWPDTERPSPVQDIVGSPPVSPAGEDPYEDED